MKPFRSTGIMILLVAAVAGYTAWEYRKAERESGDTETERKLFTFRTEAVQEIKITRGPKDSTLIKREKDEWHMLQPVDDMADSSAVEAILYSAQIQKGKVFRAEDEAKNTNWKDFGLEPPGTTLEIKTPEKTDTLFVSSKNAFDGSFYLRQGNELLLGEHGLAQAVLREPATLRSRKLWRNADTAVDLAKVELTDGATLEKYVLRKDAGKWKMEPAPSYSLDSARIDAWVSAVQNLNPTEIAGDSLGDEEKRGFLLTKPSLAISFTRAQSEWILTASQDKDEDVFLYTNQRPTIYKAGRAALAPIRVTRDYFRDGKAAFHFPLESAHEIQVNHVTIVKDGTNWKLNSADPNQELNQDKLTALLQNINKLEAQEYPPGAHPPGLKEAQIVIKDSAGKVLFSLTWGDEYKAKRIFNQGQKLRWVKTNLEKEVMGINGNRLTSLIDAKMVTTKAKPK